MDFVNDNDNPTLAQMMKPVEHIVTAPEHTDCDTAYSIMKDKKVPPSLSGGVACGVVVCSVWGVVSEGRGVENECINYNTFFCTLYDR